MRCLGREQSTSGRNDDDNDVDVRLVGGIREICSDRCGGAEAREREKERVCVCGFGRFVLVRMGF